MLNEQATSNFKRTSTAKLWYPQNVIFSITIFYQPNGFLVLNFIWLLFWISLHFAFLCLSHFRPQFRLWWFRSGFGFPLSSRNFCFVLFFFLNKKQNENFIVNDLLFLFHCFWVSCLFIYCSTRLNFTMGLDLLEFYLVWIVSVLFLASFFPWVLLSLNLFVLDDSL